MYFIQLKRTWPNECHPRNWHVEKSQTNSSKSCNLRFSKDEEKMSAVRTDRPWYGSYSWQVSGFLPGTGLFQPEVHLHPLHWEGDFQVRQQGTGSQLLWQEQEEQISKLGSERREEKGSKEAENRWTSGWGSSQCHPSTSSWKDCCECCSSARINHSWIQVWPVWLQVNLWEGIEATHENKAQNIPSCGWWWRGRGIDTISSTAISPFTSSTF